MRQPWGIKLEMQNAPGSAFVDGEMIRGIKEHLFAVLRDMVYISQRVIGAAASTSATPPASPTRCSTSCAMRACSTTRHARTWSCAGAATRSRAPNTTTPRTSATSWPARPGRLHRLRPGRHEGPDEGRDHRPRQAAHPRTAATSASPSPASSPPSRRTRSSISW